MSDPKPTLEKGHENCMVCRYGGVTGAPTYYRPAKTFTELTTRVGITRKEFDNPPRYI